MGADQFTGTHVTRVLRQLGTMRPSSLLAVLLLVVSVCWAQETLDVSTPVPSTSASLATSQSSDAASVASTSALISENSTETITTDDEYTINSTRITVPANGSRASTSQSKNGEVTLSIADDEESSTSGADPTPLAVEAASNASGTTETIESVTSVSLEYTSLLASESHDAGSESNQTAGNVSEPLLTDHSAETSEALSSSSAEPSTNATASSTPSATDSTEENEYAPFTEPVRDRSDSTYTPSEETVVPSALASTVTARHASTTPDTQPEPSSSSLSPSVTSPPQADTSPADAVTSSASAEGDNVTSPTSATAAASQSEDLTTMISPNAENATKPSPIMRYYGYPKSIPEMQLTPDETNGVTTLTLLPQHMELLTWLAVQEVRLRTRILNMTKLRGYGSSNLEWIYISPAPVLQPPNLLLSFFVRWHGGAPNTSDFDPDPGRPVTSARPPVISELEDKRRRREIAEQSGTVPASLLRRVVEDNGDELSSLTSSQMVSVVVGVPARRQALCRGDCDDSPPYNTLMVIITAVAGVCVCLTCFALLYVRLVRDSRRWDPQPAYRQGERVSGVDLNTDAECKKSEQPLPDGAGGGEVYPLSNVNNTPRSSVRRASRQQPPPPQQQGRQGRAGRAAPPPRSVNGSNNV